MTRCNSLGGLVLVAVMVFVGCGSGAPIGNQADTGGGGHADVRADVSTGIDAGGSDAVVQHDFPFGTDAQPDLSTPGDVSATDASAACNGLDEAACQQNPACAADRCTNCDGVDGFVSCRGANEPPGACPAVACPAPVCVGRDLVACLSSPADLKCSAASCTDCSGANTYAGCYGPADPKPACPPLACQDPCNGLGEVDCASRMDCEANYCKSCSSVQVFIGCTQASDPPLACPPLNCPLACKDLMDQQSCSARPDCTVNFCGGCNGQQNFSGCTGPNDPPPPCVLPPCQQFCSVLNQQQCAQRQDCQVQKCPGCMGSDTFEGCADAGSPPPICPQIACVPLQCALNQDAASCLADNTCHPVFKLQDGCTPTSGVSNMCMVFTSCADGARTNCQGPASCGQMPPQCAPPFVVSYTSGMNTNTCFEGCVLLSECAVSPL